MAKSFNIPSFYRSKGITAVKQYRQARASSRKDYSPTTIDFGPVRFKVGRYFGFCFGVENAIEIAYRALEENVGRRIFLLSEMIHNPQVNTDLQERGVRFLMDTSGEVLIPFSELRADDIVIVPAFGTTVELQAQLSEIGIDPYFYDTTCPFVEKVWRRSADLGKDGYSVIVHGKRTHEETRATFSHSRQTAPTLIVFNMKDAEYLISYMKQEVTLKEFNSHFAGSMSSDFNPETHLSRLGVVNQTTMLATETQDISNRIRQAMIEIHGEENLREHFADTRDTLCYATNENQNSTINLINEGADLAVVVGGYNSSNTSHLVELCEKTMPTYYIKNAEEIVDRNCLRHFSLELREVLTAQGWLPLFDGRPTEIAITSGASCPDVTVDQVIERIASFFEESKTFDEAFALYTDSTPDKGLQQLTSAEP